MHGCNHQVLSYLFFLLSPIFTKHCACPLCIIKMDVPSIDTKVTMNIAKIISCSDKVPRGLFSERTSDRRGTQSFVGCSGDSNYQKR